MPGAGAGLNRTATDPVDVAAAEIRELARLASWDLALGVGEIVFKRIFLGDVERVRDSGQRDESFRRLTEHPDLKPHLSVSALWRSVATYELSLRMPDLRRSGHLGVSHVREVLGLPPKVQERLLARAERERWTVRDLTSNAASSRSGQGGRPKKLEVLRAIDTLFRVTALPVQTFSDRRAVGKMTSVDVESYVAMLEELEERLDALRALLRDAAAGR